jgi:hypothetical protein
MLAPGNANVASSTPFLVTETNVRFSLSEADVHSALSERVSPILLKTRVCGGGKIPLEFFQEVGARSEATFAPLGAV